MVYMQKNECYEVNLVKSGVVSVNVARFPRTTASTTDYRKDFELRKVPPPFVEFTTACHRS